MLPWLQVPVSWEPVDVQPIKTEDGRTTVPDDVIVSMQANKVGLKGELILIQ